MREQRLIIQLGTASGNPDAAAALRSAISMVRLLESLDRKSWQLGHPRYKWEIVSASKSSPMQLEYAARRAIESAADYDLVGYVYHTLESVERKDKASLTRLDASDLDLISHIGNGKKNQHIPVKIGIPDENGARFVFYEATEKLRRSARILKEELAEVPVDDRPQYIAIEGLLTSIEADTREHRKRFKLAVVERDTERRFICQFSPDDRGVLGSHVGNRIFVEGWCTTAPSGALRLEVSTYHLIPPDPISLQELRQHGLQVPDEQSAVDYVRSLRTPRG